MSPWPVPARRRACAAAGLSTASAAREAICLLPGRMTTSMVRPFSQVSCCLPRPVPARQNSGHAAAGRPSAVDRRPGPAAPGRGHRASVRPAGPPPRTVPAPSTGPSARLIQPNSRSPVTSCASTRPPPGRTSTSRTPMPPNCTARVCAHISRRLLERAVAGKRHGNGVAGGHHGRQAQPGEQHAQREPQDGRQPFPVAGEEERHDGEDQHRGQREGQAGQGAPEPVVDAAHAGGDVQGEGGAVVGDVRGDGPRQQERRQRPDKLSTP